ncbi:MULTISPECIES: L-threonylcarbamoyladenylate synthase type 1 TsaC [Lonsdalea]|uniref:L-threonylcarbamoyladenylate synthase TsaC n=2 Tax=Lonsdalea TaxID=1082702 RepID=A0ACD1JB22_9GAMM|nr:MULTISPECIES: L-threonylcarbamoyladenylate synthase type 1 TsaC [Lonsdalea]RAT10932.1 L-threonylcarbamoyladenylate synthase TsaC [Lonsdalea quercina]RAT18300.1 L-threonylcarbamoyladenylate synthase TsaC [Lonsdalea populi]RAT21678.1 L-threonylcarbamoyladenylate synthase TsaC [Lonsdalea populi]RAT23172.1 L-threonylcarbamoyladenylate synthase TsaC [Lonsdalea populi]RAT31356.1 L-threonylcarbamoyladenylate synthase TsaC [Lonsdalea populi]
MNNIIPPEQWPPLLKNLEDHKVIAYPTEAVFGLGCDPDSEIAVQRLLDLKRRPWQKGLILIAAEFQQLELYVDVSALSEAQLSSVFSTWPGPVTWVMPTKPSTPQWLTGEFTTLAVRLSDHPLVIELCRRFGKPLVSTSANLSGKPPCRTAKEVFEQFGKAFPVLEGAIGGRQNPSEIRDASTGAMVRSG